MESIKHFCHGRFYGKFRKQFRYMLKHSLECLLLCNGNGDKRNIRSKNAGLYKVVHGMTRTLTIENDALNSKIRWSTTALVTLGRP